MNNSDEIFEKVTGIKDMVFDHSFDIDMSVKKCKKDKKPWKSVCVHHNGSTALWKIALVMMGVIGFFAVMCCCLCRKKH